MNNQIAIILGAVAVVAVVAVTAFSMTASRDTKKTISESIPHGTNEQPINK